MILLVRVVRIRRTLVLVLCVVVSGFKSVPCYRPIPAYRLRGGSVSFKHTEDCSELMLPCGSCIGCRLERSRQWAVRMMHESQMHDTNSFITLTYRPEDLPLHGVCVHHFQDFMKRLRSRLSPRAIRFFHCGEYGEKFSRPHYHAIIFGFDFPDKLPFKEANGHVLFQSPFLEEVWSFGHCLVGSVSFESCAYVARYIVKKVLGEKGLDHYFSLNELTGELVEQTPEYCTMSRRPGIGARWMEKFGTEVFHNDSVVMRGFEQNVPRFYESFFDELDLEALKGSREVASYRFASDHTAERLKVQEVVKVAQVSFLKRSFEDESQDFRSF